MQGSSEDLVVAGPSTQPYTTPRSSPSSSKSQQMSRGEPPEYPRSHSPNFSPHRSTMFSMSSDLSAVEADVTTIAPTHPQHSSKLPSRHPDFWLYDGSIILSVESTLFRVHQTILANHSEIFADLFTVPQPQGEHMMDGCHMVYLQDSEKDFEDLLKAVYVPECVIIFLFPSLPLELVIFQSF